LVSRQKATAWQNHYEAFLGQLEKAIQPLSVM
jgi:hypothetical protein